MRLSTRGEYGVRAMLKLAASYGEGPMSLAEIAQHEKISLAYLEQLIAPLRKRGLVRSTRGARGGYRLAKAPERISVGDIVRTLEGPIAPMECASEEESPGCCEHEKQCLTRDLWLRLRDRIAELLDSTTLADLRSGAKGN